ncbi:unnamed protein product [Boreogadus saida]
MQKIGEHLYSGADTSICAAPVTANSAVPPSRAGTEDGQIHMQRYKGELLPYESAPGVLTEDNASKSKRQVIVALHLCSETGPNRLLLLLKKAP